MNFSSSWDVVISGAGLIGVSLALELHARGAKVLVLDSGEPGREASSAAAGMLAPADPETPSALQPLALASAQLFPDYVQKLESAAQMTVDFRRIGAIAFLESSIAPHEYKALSGGDLKKLEPSLNQHGHPAFFVKEDSVDPHLLIQAALKAAHNLGIEIRGHAAVKRFSAQHGQVIISSEAGEFTAKAAVNCQGAWSGMPVKPRKGQMLYVQPNARPATTILQHVLRTPEVYVVPRSNGKILIGATVEDVGFDKSVAPAIIQKLLGLAAKYLPALAPAPITQSWAGLRPGTPDDLPILGPDNTDPAAIPQTFIASGHFRNGILLAPITAKIMADLISGKPSSLDISAFSPARFGSGTV